MTTTTHITAACLITALAIKSGLGPVEKLLVVAAASLASHYIIDIIPHGFVADLNTVFKNIIPTLLEFAPGLIILFSAIAMFGSPLLFLWAAGSSIFPDVVTTLSWKSKGRALKLPGFSPFHLLHRKVHWFETDNPDGSISYLFPNRPMLTVEVVFVTVLLLVLFVQLRP